jgi:hypothetical protein
MNTAHTRLVEAINKSAKAGKVLDVSGLNPDGTGSRIVNIPKSDRGTKKWVPGVPIISDNYTTYALAMRILGEQYVPYADQYQAMHGVAKMVRSPKVATGQGAMAPFPMTQNMPALIAATPGVPLMNAKSPRGPKTPKVPKSPAVRQTAILQVPGGMMGMTRVASPPRIPVVNPPMPIIPGTLGRAASPPRVQGLNMPNIIPLTPIRAASPTRAQSPNRVYSPTIEQRMGTIPIAPLRATSPGRAQSPPRVYSPTVQQQLAQGLVAASPTRAVSPGRTAVPFIPTMRVPSPTK